MQPRNVTTRQRTRPSRLPAFEPRFNCDARWAWYDKIDVSFDIASIRSSDPEEVRHLFARISRSSRLFKNTGSVDFPRLTIEKGKLGLLFGGTLQIQRPELGGRNQVKANLSLNMTRYFAHNPPSRPVQQGEHAQYYQLTQNDPLMYQIRKECLDGNDNLVLNNQVGRASRTDWGAMVLDLLRRISCYIADEFARYDPEQEIICFNPERLTRWTIKSMEIYWEFRCPDAALVAHNFGMHAANHFVRSRSSYHPNKDDNGVCTSFVFYTPRENVHLAFYAKTEDRIRVECRFTTYPKKIFTRQLSDGDYSRNSVLDLQRMLSTLTLNAQDIVKPLQNSGRTYKTKYDLHPSYALDIIRSLNFIDREDQRYLAHVVRDILLTDRVSETDDERYNAFLGKMRERSHLISYRKAKNKPRAYRPASGLKMLLSALSPSHYPFRIRK